MKPKTFNEVKDAVAVQYGYRDYNQMCDGDFIEDYFEEIAKAYAREMVKHHLQKAAENAMLENHDQVDMNGDEYVIISIDKESITGVKIELL